MDKETRVWLNVLAEFCHCYPDEEGGMPCDYGCVCDRCMTKEVKDIYRLKMKESEGND